MKGLGIYEISRALGKPFAQWVELKELDHDTAVKGIERYLKGAKIHGYWAQIAIRELFADLGFPLRPTQPLPPARVLVALVEEALEKKNRKGQGGSDGN